MPNGNQLYGGTLADFDTADNMAKEIESAFAAMRVSAGITQPLPTGVNAQDMRIMFLAVARGVIQHLKNNPAAFAVQVKRNAITSNGNVTSVSVL
jgi:hypothetical protein